MWKNTHGSDLSFMMDALQYPNGYNANAMFNPEM